MSRSVSRVAMLLAIAVGVVTCSESPTGARRPAVRLALAPHFSTAAAAIYRSLSGFDVTLDNVHVVVRDATPGDEPGRLLEDTTIAFPANQNEITIDIDLTITGEQERVVAEVELREGSTAYFAGGQAVVATRGQTTTAPEQLELAYVGPGAGAAFASVTPDAATLAPSSSFQFSARVLDQAEHVVTNLPLTWTTSDATIAAVTPTGLVTSTAKTGTVTLTVAGLNGISQQTTLRVQPVASLAVHSGAGQSAIAGGTLTSRFEVQALDATQQPVIGAPITFSAVNGAGSVSTTSATTDASGLASTSVTLGSTAGTYTFTAQAGAGGGSTAVARIVATATAGAAASLSIVGGNQQADTVLATLGKPLTVRVADASGNPVPGQVVDFRVTSGQAGLLASAGAAPALDLQVTTGTDGTASVSLVGGAVAGTLHVTASVAQTTVTPAIFQETLQPGVASQLLMVQQPSPTAQATITLGRQPKVQVADLYGNAVAVAGVSISASYTLDCGSGPVCGRVVAPRSGGVLLNRTAEPTTRASSPKRPSLTRSIPSRPRLTMPVAIAATRSVSDTFPQGLGGTTQVVTDGNGIASFSDLSLDLSVVQGGWQLTFFDANETLASAVSNDIVLSPGPVTSIVAQFGQDTLFYSTVSDTLHPAVVIIDPVGNGIPGVAVTWAVQDGFSRLGTLTTQTDANGVASPGNWVLSSPTGGLLNFEIVATPNASKVENAPLHLFALPLLQ
jgi:Big-like domain-containing protein